MIRRASVFDSEAIFKIESLTIECAWTQQQIKEAILDESYVYFVAEVSGSVVAYGGVRLIIDEAEICNIATSEDFRRQGFANEILFELENYCFSHGIKSMFLEVNTKNQPAISLYKRDGFKTLNIRKNYYSSGDAVVMIKELKKLRKKK